MTVRLIAGLAVALTFGIPTPQAAEPIAADAIRAAAARGLELLVKTSPTFIKKGGCNSCHNQMLPAAAQALARRRGIAAGDPIAQLPAAISEGTAERYAEYSVAGGAGVNALGFELFAADAAGLAADARVRAAIRYIKGQQQPDGYWRGGGSIANHAQQALSRPAAARPPLTFDDFTPTAYMVRAVKAYGAPAEAADNAARIDRARRWLLAATPRRLQEQAFRLLGLRWSSAEPRAIDSAARALQTLQNANGGFSQLPTLPSDAYATGIALFALSEAGVPPAHPTYQAALKFLLSTQAADGTWHVRSRSLEFQPYFESGYPYGRDQWISSAAASYAVIAMAAAVDPPRSTRP
jgi:squalene cyclase